MLLPCTAIIQDHFSVYRPTPFRHTFVCPKASCPHSNSHLHSSPSYQAHPVEHTVLLPSSPLTFAIATFPSAQILFVTSTRPQATKWYANANAPRAPRPLRLARQRTTRAVMCPMATSRSEVIQSEVPHASQGVWMFLA